MPQTIKVKQEDGTEIDQEVFSKEELDAAATAKADEVAAEKQTAIESLEAEKAEKEDELKKLQDVDRNWKDLRKKADGKGASEEEVKKQIEDLTKRLDQVATQPINDTKAEFIRTEVGEDKERKDKFEYYYKRLGAEAKTKEEVLKASKEALVLATNGEYKPDGTDKMMGTGASQNYRNEKPRQKGEQFNEMAKAMGNTPEDIKKYGGQS